MLSDSNYRQMFTPPGFTHWYCVISETVVFSYKCTDFYNPAIENGIIFNDPDLDIDSPMIKQPVLSAKDANYPILKDLAPDKLPHFQ